MRPASGSSRPSRPPPASVAATSSPSAALLQQPFRTTSKSLTRPASSPASAKANSSTTSPFLPPSQPNPARSQKSPKARKPAAGDHHEFDRSATFSNFNLQSDFNNSEHACLA